MIRHSPKSEVVSSAPRRLPKPKGLLLSAPSRALPIPLRILEFIGRPLFYLILSFLFFSLIISSTLLHTIKLALGAFFKLTNTLILTIRRQISLFLSPKAKKSGRKPVQVYPPLLARKFPFWRFYKLKFPRPRLTVPSLLVSTSVVGFFAVTLAFWFLILRDLPSPKTLTTRPQALTTRIFDRNGKLLFKFYKNENRSLVPLPEIPLSLRQATVAIEDKNFYSHSGISYRGIARAIWRNLSTGSLAGGSTITQQLVKNTLLSPEKTLRRKIREIVLALGVELTFTKDQILEMYLNEVPYGGATYGVSEAAESYFGKRVQDLNLAESAFLAGLPASPTEFSPYGTHPEAAKQRQKEVLDRMAQDGDITQKAADETLAAKLPLRQSNIDILAPHFVMYVKEILSRKYGDAMVEQGGLQVFTSLDLSLQETVQKIVTSEVDKILFLHITNGSALVTVPATGEILAMVGSRDYFDTKSDGNVNATLALRQPGSSIKPVNYAVALANNFTAATVIPDTPITFRIPGQPSYSPVNYDGRFHGNVTLRTALASSYNVPAVKVLSAVGVSQMLEQGKKMGITTWNDPGRFGLSLTLGGGDVRMVDMASVYGTLANLGSRVDLQPILRVDDSRGHTLEKYTCTEAKLPPTTPTAGFLTKSADTALQTESYGCNRQTVLDPRIAYTLTDILSDNAARTPAFGPHSDLVIPGHQVAVKTGTTNNLKDNWTIGYTPQFLVATWVGNFDSSPMSYVASGVTGASPIWNKIMTYTLKDRPKATFSPPPDLFKVEICSLTGTLSCGACPSKRVEYFLPDTAPTRACDEEMIKKIEEERKKAEEKGSNLPPP